MGVSQSGQSSNRFKLQAGNVVKAGSTALDRQMG